ncbi:MAG: hypothetical protein NTW96_25055, partial [Planctomycetia bacterium]|nr:hypothetical protein [Planctomycetia bacterium]
MKRIVILGWVAIVLPLFLGTTAAEALWLDVRTRDATGQAVQQTVDIDPAKTAVVVIDMWDSHYDDVFVTRAPNVIPRMNQTMDICRDLGMQVVWAPANDIPYYEVPSHDGYAQRQAMKAIPYHAMPSPKSFNPPDAPYYAKSQNMTPPGVTGIPVWPATTRQHPDLVIAPNDLIVNCDNAQELWNLIADRDIEQLIFAGHATNWCLDYRACGMINMQRYMDNKPIFIRDLTEAMSCNGYNWETNQIDWSTSPDTGTADAVRHNERYIGGSIQAGQLLQEDPQYSYTSRISQEDGLLAYWRMDCKNGYKTLRDYHGTEGLWNAQTVTLGVPGVTADGDTAAWFGGTSAMIASPKYRTQLPVGSSLESLSSGSFTVEAWV